MIFDFWAPKAVCPKCGADGGDPRFGDVVVARVIIHLDPPSGKVRGTGKRPCDGKPVNTGADKGHGASGNPTVVTCPDCRMSDAWARLAEEWGEEVPDPAQGGHDRDFVLALDPKTGSIKKG